jgi:prophage maintenance system killer protein
MEFNQELVDNILLILDESLSFCNSEMTSKENMGLKYSDKSIFEIQRIFESAISALVQKFHYESNQKSIFNFAAQLFIKIINGHYLSNGNKRLAIASTMKLLFHFGWY